MTETEPTESESSEEEKFKFDPGCLVMSGSRKRRLDPNLWRMNYNGLLSILKAEAFRQRSKMLEGKPEDPSDCGKGQGR